MSIDFEPTLAEHGFLLEEKDGRSRTYVQADGNLTATWDLWNGGIYLWFDHGVANGAGHVTYVGSAQTPQELIQLIGRKQ